MGPSFRDRHERPRHLLARARGIPDILVIAPARRSSAPSSEPLWASSRATSAASSTTESAAFVDAILALPLIILAILIVTAVGSTRRRVVTLTIGLIFTPVISRTVRAAVLAETELEYVAGRSAQGRALALHHVLGDPPERDAVVVVEFTVRLGYAIFTVATLTFIGFGVPPPSPDWAAQINQYWTLIDPYWWMTLFPALAIASLVIAVNLVSDGIREVYER